MIRPRLTRPLLRPALAALALAAGALGGCTTKTETKDYTRPLPPGMMALEKITDPMLLPDFRGGYPANREDRAALLESVEQSIAYLSKPSSKKYYPYLDVTHDRVKASLLAFKQLAASAGDADSFHREILRRFDVYRSVGCDFNGTVLFTGYCTPIYEGSRRRTERFRYPLYRLPEDLVKLPSGRPLGRGTPDGIVPYWTRQEIEQGRQLEGKGLELVWLKDPLEAFIVHVQGSARIRLPDGKEMRIGYAGKTDRPYGSLGQALVKDGKIRREEMSLRKIKEYFAVHPDELSFYLGKNQSYVFFTENDGGPFGSLGVAVTPYRSLATDKSVFPRAAVAFAQTRVPAAQADGTLKPRPYTSFLLDQDTGGAIRSAGRSDLYFGVGPRAELLAGHTEFEGRLYYVFLKPGEWSPRIPSTPAISSVGTAPGMPGPAAPAPGGAEDSQE